MPLPSLLRTLSGTTALLALLASGGLFAPRPATAEVDPHATLPVRNHELNRQLSAEGVEIYAEAMQDLEKFEEQAEGGSIVRVDLDAIGAVYIASQQLIRLGDRLILLGEPAGGDMRFRGQMIEARIREVMSAYLAIEAGEERRDRSLAALVQRSEAQQQRRIAQLDRLVEDEKWEEASAEMYELIDHIDELGVWFDRDTRTRAVQPYITKRTQIDNAMKELRTQEAIAQIEEDLAETTPDFEAYVESLRTAAAGIDTEGFTEYKGEQLTGPQVASAWVADYEALHRQALQTRLLLTALWGVGGGSSQAITDLDKAYANARDDAYEAVKELIDADAANLAEADVPMLHGEYVAALAPLAGQTSDDALLKIAPALDRLAARSPAFQAQLTAYQAATNDYLRWSERIAEEAAARQVETAYPHFQSACLEAIREEGDWPGLIPESVGTLEDPQLRYPLPLVTGPVVESLQGTNVSFGPAVGMGDGQRALIQYADSGMAGLTLPAQWQDAVAQLEQGLLADATHPPLSLQAAAALASARRGDTLAAGATVTDLDLKGYLPFFAALPGAASAITPLDTLPRDMPKGDTYMRLILRFSLDTDWARGRHLFVAGG